MSKIILILSLVSGLLAISPSKLNLQNERITGAIAANLELFPYVTSLRSDNGWIGCSGCIIDTKWVVTAASCTNRVSDMELRVAAGSVSAYNGGQEIRVQNIYQHPEFDPVSLSNDISILELDEDIIYSQIVNKLNLPAEDQSVVIGAPANITGWGRTYEGGNYPAVLLTTFVNIVSQGDCREVYGEAVTDNMICASYSTGGRGACQGDEGGPLVINNELIGIISWRRVCGDADIPEVYTRVPTFRSFIAEITGL